MGFLDDFQASLESLLAMLQKNYALMRDLDRSLHGVQQQNEQRCEEEIEQIKHLLASGSLTYDPSVMKFSDDAVEEQKHCVRIADEKVSLAIQTYDMVDAHIQYLDEYMRKLEEKRQEKEAAVAAAGVGTSEVDTVARGGRGERGRGGRKKSKPAVEPPPIDLEIPVDPNEPTYCLCNQVSYGEMVACDNPEVRKALNFSCRKQLF